MNEGETNMPDRRIHTPEGKQPLAPPPERKDAQASSRTAKGDAIRHAGIGIMALLLWWGAYSSLVPLSQWLTCDLLSIEGGTPLGDAVEFFFYDTPKILLLLALMIYVVGWLRAGAARRARPGLSGRKRAGNRLCCWGRDSGRSRRSVPAPAFPCFSVLPWPAFRWASPWPF